MPKTLIFLKCRTRRYTSYKKTEKFVNIGSILAYLFQKCNISSIKTVIFSIKFNKFAFIIYSSSPENLFVTAIL